MFQFEACPVQHITDPLASEFTRYFSLQPFALDKFNNQIQIPYPDRLVTGGDQMHLDLGFQGIEKRQMAESTGRYLAVRTRGVPLALAGFVRSVVWEMDANIPIPEITTMKARVDAGRL